MKKYLYLKIIILFIILNNICNISSSDEISYTNCNQIIESLFKDDRTEEILSSANANKAITKSFDDCWKNNDIHNILCKKILTNSDKFLIFNIIANTFQLKNQKSNFVSLYKSFTDEIIEDSIKDEIIEDSIKEKIKIDNINSSTPFKNFDDCYEKYINFLQYISNRFLIDKFFILPLKYYEKDNKNFCRVLPENLYVTILDKIQSNHNEILTKIDILNKKITGGNNLLSEEVKSISNTVSDIKDLKNLNPINVNILTICSILGVIVLLLIFLSLKLLKVSKQVKKRKTCTTQENKFNNDEKINNYNNNYLRENIVPKIYEIIKSKIIEFNEDNDRKIMDRINKKIENKIKISQKNPKITTNEDIFNDSMLKIEKSTFNQAWNKLEKNKHFFEYIKKFVDSSEYKLIIKKIGSKLPELVKHNSTLYPQCINISDSINNYFSKVIRIDYFTKNKEKEEEILKQKSLNEKIFWYRDNSQTIMQLQKEIQRFEFFDAKKWVLENFIDFADLFILEYQKAKLKNSHKDLEEAKLIVLEVLDIVDLEPVEVDLYITRFDSRIHIARSTVSNNSVATGVIVSVIRNGFKYKTKNLYYRQPEVIVNKVV